MELTPQQQFLQSMYAYFQSEKKSGIYLLVWGILVLASTVCYLCMVGGELFHGIFYPSIAIAIAHVLIGGNVLTRAHRLVPELEEGLRMFPKEMLAGEKSRMAQAISNFERFKTVEMLLFFMGFAFMLGGAFGGFGKFMLGTGIGLSLQVAVSLIFDLFAAFRASFYERALDKLESAAR